MDDLDKKINELLPKSSPKSLQNDGFIAGRDININNKSTSLIAIAFVAIFLAISLFFI